MGSCNILGVFSSGGGGATAVTPNFIVGALIINPSYTTNAIRYAGLFTETYATASASTTESQVQAPIHFAWQLNRVFVNVLINDKNADSLIGIRDDGSTAGSVTITASTTGEFDSGALEVDVASGSDVNWIVDTNSSSSGELGAIRTSLAYGQST